MIDLKRKEDCVGCNACVQICPKQCISFNSDEQGFKYPLVDLDLCINCGLCEKTCPVIHQDEPKTPLKTYAAVNPDEGIRNNSSSGGIFHSLAEITIRKGGVVFGARYDSDWSIIHDYTETLEDIQQFQRSKYTQSAIRNSFKEAQKFLKDGRSVLFSGTPCQIAALRLFLRKDYGRQLMLVDVVCHGVPSPMIWSQYLSHLSKEEGFSMNDITNINFRDKKISWEVFGLKVSFRNKDIEKEYFSPLNKNIYMQGFLKDLYLRPSCYQCPAKCGKSHSDITLADFWGIRNKYPSLYSQKGVSLILTNTPKGKDLLTSTQIKRHAVAYSDALESNPSIEKSVAKPYLYQWFWEEYGKSGFKALEDTLRKMRPSLRSRLIHNIKSGLIKLIGKSTVTKIKSYL